MKWKQIQQLLKEALLSAIDSVVSRIDQFTVHPGRDFTRSRKIPLKKLILFLITMGSSRTIHEILDFYDSDPESPTNSAFCQQRSKLLSSALEEVFHVFNETAGTLIPSAGKNVHFLAVDGSSLTFGTNGLPGMEEYLVPDRSEDGHYSMHMNALYDCDRHIYLDNIIQSASNKDEYGAFCDLVDRFQPWDDGKYVFIGDRGYCSLNNMAHVMQKGQYFVFRAKDITSQGLTQGLDLPEEGSFDSIVNLALTRSHSQKVITPDGFRRKNLNTYDTFDYLEHKTLGTYEMTFRVIRFQLEGGGYECIITNLPKEDYPAESFIKVYFVRWDIEVSFRDLKYTNALTALHAYKPEHIKQEIWAAMIQYNLTQMMLNCIGEPKKGTKHEHKANFGVAAHECMKFLRKPLDYEDTSLIRILSRFTVPKRKNRKCERNPQARRRPDTVYRSA